MSPAGGNGGGDGQVEVKRFSHGSRVPGWDRAVDLDKDPAAIPEPSRRPRLQAPWSAERIGRPSRSSIATP